MTAPTLLAAMQAVRAETQEAAERNAELLATTGRMAARLHNHHGWSWPQLGRALNVNASTAWRWAKPYLHDD